MNPIVLAWRNLLRNRRRSLVTLLSIAFGIAALALFAGYTQTIYVGLANLSIHGEMIGHLTVEKRGWRTAGKLDPGRYLLSPAEIARVDAIVKKRLPQGHVLPRMALDGMIANGRNGTIFIAEGIDPRDLRLVLGPLSGVYRNLSVDKPDGVAVGEALAGVLGLQRGSDASLLVSTIHGQANAADVEVNDVINTGNTATNDKFLLVPLALSRMLKDIGQQAEWLTVLVNTPATAGGRLDRGLLAMLTTPPPDARRTAAMRDRLAADFKAAGLDLEVRTWQDMSLYYKQVKNIYDLIFTLLLAIVLAIVVLSIANSMSMSVLERTREIGTLRAMGYRRGRVVRLFVIEACLAVWLGCLLGLLLFWLASQAVNAAGIQYVPPGNSVHVPLFIDFDPLRTVLAMLLLGTLSVAAAWLPARKAARQMITVSLAHS
ncbi:MAG: ABC transporter permease [Paludibacterium sp.]|uniref:ABC transporter permease n=1 Tax=Paludibacterium sp. TaxID=1917523 RepID=UPI0025D02437|nr:FtsX-like permease family protein [Paludibacterium sp.]MBV8047796.1 ABC transporter permease [Paludibacterium sp.]MBV8649295.1 ABC transporter permease [Paludibacterium sp.]